MHRRLKLKRKTSFKKNLLIYIFILVLCFSLIAIVLFNKIVSPMLFGYAKMQTERLAHLVIINSVDDTLTNKLDPETLFSTTTTDDGYIQSIDFNPVIVNSVLNRAVKDIKNNLISLEKGDYGEEDLPGGIINELDLRKIKKGIVLEIPLGIVTKNAFLANLGPKIPVRLNYIGDARGYLKTKISTYGINNSLIEVYIHIELTERISLPLFSSEMKIEKDILVAMKIMQGKVPNYYNGSLEKNSSIFTLPITE